MVLEGELSFHPFQSGMVHRKDNNGLYVCANGGAILISEILDEHGRKINEKSL